MASEWLARLLRNRVMVFCIERRVMACIRMALSENLQSKHLGYSVSICKLGHLLDLL